MCASPPCLTVYSSFPSLLTCCFLLVRGVHNRELEKVEDDESGGEEQPEPVLLLIDLQTKEEELIFPPVVNQRRIGTNVS